LEQRTCSGDIRAVPATLVWGAVRMGSPTYKPSVKIV
jgi:hypothetical protein